VTAQDRFPPMTIAAASDRFLMLYSLRRLAARVLPARVRPHGIVTRRLLAVSGGRVMQGPFRGMSLVVDPSVLDWPKLLGTYERELHPVIERAVQPPPRAVINVGSAEGYYAVGLAVRCPSATVLAFDDRPQMREHVARMAVTNGVADRVRVQGWCGEPELSRALAEHPTALLVVDIEGGEVDLLDPDREPALRVCPILVEEHDFIRPGCSDLLTARFARTHRVEVIREVPRRPADLPVRWPLAGRWLGRLMHEGRPAPQSWLYLTPLRP
jgi:hypothetical protein